LFVPRQANADSMGKNQTFKDGCDMLDKVALVLGSVKGIGKAVGLDLARAGARVVYTYYDWPESLPALQKDAAGTGREHLIVPVDLLDPRAVADLVGQVVARFGRLDILVNNIERGGWPVVHGPYVPAQWDLEMATTLRAKQWVFSAALPHLKATGDGVAVNISSIAGIVGRSGPASYIFNEGYAAANRGVALLTETWARLGAPEVRVNEIMLGIFDTRHARGTRGWDLLDDRQRQAVLDHTLLGRTGRLDDVVRAVRFIVQDAPFMTGSVLRLDGGYVLGGAPVAPMPKGVV
jgi:3-oxoacyl-[acyl-carrier protein] reductase